MFIYNDSAVLGLAARCERELLRDEVSRCSFDGVPGLYNILAYEGLMKSVV